MAEEMSAAYCGLSVNSFRQAVAKMKLPALEMDLRVLRWARADLDRMIDSLLRRGVTLPAEPEGQVVDQAEGALARAKKRARRCPPRRER